MWIGSHNLRWELFHISTKMNEITDDISSEDSCTNQGKLNDSRKIVHIPERSTHHACIFQQVGFVC